MKFPRKLADLDAAPWCQSYDPPEHENDHFLIYINSEWLPIEMNETISANGLDLEGALSDLKSHFWPHIQAP